MNRFILKNVTGDRGGDDRMAIISDPEMGYNIDKPIPRGPRPQSSSNLEPLSVVRGSSAGQLTNGNEPRVSASIVPSTSSLKQPLTTRSKHSESVKYTNQSESLELIPDIQVRGTDSPSKGKSKKKKSSKKFKKYGALGDGRWNMFRI